MKKRKRHTLVRVSVRIRRLDGRAISRQEAEQVFRKLVDTQRVDPEYTVHAIDWEKGGKEYHYEGDKVNGALQRTFPLIEQGTKLRVDAPDQFS